MMDNRMWLHKYEHMEDLEREDTSWMCNIIHFIFHSCDSFDCDSIECNWVTHSVDSNALFLVFREALSVVEDLKMCVLELEEEGGPCPGVELMDPSVARIYSKSARGKVVIHNMILIYSLK